MCSSDLRIDAGQRLGDYLGLPRPQPRMPETLPNDHQDVVGERERGSGGAGGGVLCDAGSMRRWESTVVTASFAWGRTGDIEHVLARMDAEGWEVVGVSTADMVPPTVLLIFKRPFTG